MSRAARRGAALALALGAVLGCSVGGQGAPTIELHARSPVVGGRDIVVHATQHGALERRRVTFTISLDTSTLARIDSDGSRAEIRVPTATLAPGVHRIGVKTGRERAAIDVRVIPIWVAIAALALLAALLLFLLRLAFRRARGEAGPGRM